MCVRPTFFVLTALSLAATTAFAQPEPRVAVSLAGGLASGASETGGALGGSVLFDMSKHVSLEGHATYLDRGPGADGFTAGGTLVVNLLRSTDPVVPFGVVGGGVYHASYDLAHARFLGPAGMQFEDGTTVCPAPGAGFGPGHGPGFGSGMGDCPAAAVGFWGVGELPDFYARRLGPLAFPHGGAWGMRTFTDPALSLGGGVRFNVTERLMFRPDFRALVLFGDGQTHTLAVLIVNVGYRF